MQQGAQRCHTAGAGGQGPGGHLQQQHKATGRSADCAAQVERRLVQRDGQVAVTLGLACQDQLVVLRYLQGPADGAPQGDGQHHQPGAERGRQRQHEQRHGKDQHDGEGQHRALDAVHQRADQEASQHAADAPDPQVGRDRAHRAVGRVGQQRGDEGVHAQAGDGREQGDQQDDQHMAVAEDRQLLTQRAGGGDRQLRELQ
ncbi:hypothetical protein D3C84_860630 [compost metagenome]